jgi:nucleoside-diphosphate-sugar epimerase
VTTLVTGAAGFLGSYVMAARQVGVRRIVLASSNAAYHGPTGTKLVETDPVFSITRGNPAAHYGTTKIMQEAVGLAYAGYHGLDVTALQVTAIYGFGIRHRHRRCAFAARGGEQSHACVDGRFNCACRPRLGDGVAAVQGRAGLRRAVAARSGAGREQ